MTTDLRAAIEALPSRANARQSREYGGLIERAAVLTLLDAILMDAAWAEAEAALLAQPGGSPYLGVTCDLMAWCEATASDSSGLWTAEGDTPALALRAVAAELRGETP